MQLDKLRIELRPRTGWQAVDLGCRMAVFWFRPLFFIWLLVSLPIFIAIVWLSPLWAIILVWLLKPLFERAQLYYLSRAVFSAEPSVTETLKNWPGQCKNGGLSSCTLTRILFSRSYRLAVFQLEQLKGSARKNRLRIFHRDNDDQSAWWGVVCYIWEWILFAGLLSLFGWLTPQGVAPFDFYQLFYSEYWQLISATLIYVCFALVSPFYLAGGFSLYLNRRVMLEAWDIELAFKKIRQRLVSKVSVFVMCAFCFTGVSTTFSPVHANPPKVNINLSAPKGVKNTDVAEQTKRMQTKLANTQKLIDQVYQKEPFKNVKTTKHLVWVGPDLSVSSDFDLSFLAEFIKSISLFIEIMLWAIFIIGFFALVFYLRKHLFFWRKFKKVDLAEKVQMPDFIVDDRSEYAITNCHQFIQLVETAIANADFRFALSLIIRFSLHQMSQAYRVRLSRSMTEQECLNSLKQEVPTAIYEHIAAVFKLWIQLAWAHRSAQHDEVQSLYQKSIELFVHSKKAEAK
ncbi:hypothetical protein [Gayadomonas joobiniege]|uniref:hypothetical protein n=1 Tax=Gayadomonas joobiniege TaxID=1234606 RepID=UPI000375AE72|nr:hypothetical protein [Gayadomonas joobiniege]